MALPSSGPLSLNDIAGEFGGSTPHSLSEYYAGGGLVPAGTSGTYGAVPSSGTISIQNFYGTSNVVYWINNAAYNSGTGYISLAADDTIYVGTSTSFAIKYSADGASYSWLIFLNSQQYLYYDAKVTSAGELLCAGTEGLGKLNTSGGNSWFNGMLGGANPGTSYLSAVQAITCTTNDSVGCGVGNYYDSGYIPYMAAYAFNVSNGSQVASRTFDTGGGSSYFSDVSPVGTSGFILAGRINGYAQVGVVSTDTSLGINWGRYVSANSGQTSGFSAHVQATGSGEAYVSWAVYPTHTGSAQYGVGLLKLDSGGNFAWARIYWTASTQCSSNDISLDSSGNVYVLGAYTVGGYLLLLKYNSSGTIQWARYISGVFGASLEVKGSAMYISASSSSTQFVLKLPTDGSKTGTYTVGGVTITYAVDTVGGNDYPLGVTVTGQSYSNPYAWAPSGFSPSNTAQSTSVSRTLI